MPLTQVQSGMLGSDSQNYGFKNRVINGAMTIDQRNAGASQSWNNNNGYCLDRYFTYNSGGGGVYTTQQISDAPAGFNNSLRVTVTTADSSLAASDLYFLQHKIEGFNAADLGWGTANAQPVTISFWVKSSLTGSFPFTIIDTAGGANYTSYGVLYTINSANAWEYKSFTIPGPTTGTWSKTNGVGMQLSMGLGGGSQYIMGANAWTANKEAYQITGNVNLISTLNATWQITGLQLEKGTAATAFDYRPYGTELQLCQRYYQKSYNYLTLPGAVIGGNAGIQTSFGAVSSGIIGGATTFPVVMRTDPTLTVYDNNGNSARVTIFNAGATPTDNIPLNTSNATETRMMVRIFGYSAAGLSYMYTVSAEI
jgi:hypothetical protein